MRIRVTILNKSSHCKRGKPMQPDENRREPRQYTEANQGLWICVTDEPSQWRDVFDRALSVSSSDGRLLIEWSNAGATTSSGSGATGVEEPSPLSAAWNSLLSAALPACCDGPKLGASPSSAAKGKVEAAGATDFRGASTRRCPSGSPSSTEAPHPITSLQRGSAQPVAKLQAVSPISLLS